MESTGLLDVFRTRLGLEQSTEKTADRPQEPNILEPDLQPETPAPPDEKATPEQQPEDQTREPESDTPSPADIQDPEPDSEPAPDPAGEPEQSVEMRTAQLYYITVTDSGQVKPQQVSRQLPGNSTPLTANIRALLTGPSARELNNGLLSLIPEDSDLLSASVSNRTAYLNFSEGFRYNSLGAEGLIAQLQQIVYTATEFSTVDRVQFLIDGRQLNYLGGDGVYIGQPLGRDSF